MVLLRALCVSVVNPNAFSIFEWITEMRQKTRSVNFRCNAFTLVELLVVIAIIGILVALLLPAVQAAREAARRAQCINNMKQVGIAMHLYHDAEKTLPGGAISCCFGTWANELLPYLEEGNLASTWAGGTYTSAANQPLMARRIAAYTCPSDMPNSPTITAGVPMCNHNYAANYGNTTYAQATYIGTKFLGAPFGNIENYNGSGFDRYGARPYLGKIPFKRIPDGLSKTLLVSEIRQGQANDLRGRIVGFANGGAFTAFDTPNSASLDLMGNCDMSDPMNHPCKNATDGGNRLTSRSRHPGGVNSLMADGSVAFYTDSIAVQPWQALATTRGEDITAEQ